MVPPTIKPSLLNVPIFTVSSEKTSKIGKPETSLTAKSEPERLSVTENNWPSEPIISNSVEPLDSIVRLPLTSKLPEIPELSIYSKKRANSS